MSEMERRIAALSPEQQELLLRRLREKSAPATTPRIEHPRIRPQENRHEPVPLTGIQEAYWIGRSGAFALGGCGANVYVEHELTGSAWTFASALETAVRRLVDHHEILRVVILPDGRQQVLPSVPPFQVFVEDLSGYRAGRIEKTLEGVRQEMIYGLQPVEKWPLFEILVHQLPGGKIRTHARFDAMLIDGIGRTRIIEELVHLVDNPEAELRSLEISFLDHARALAAFRESETYRRSRDYWRERVPLLAPWPSLPVVCALEPSTVPRFVKRERQLLPAEVWSRLRQRAARLSLTPTGLLLAAFAEVVRSKTRSSEFTLAVEGSYLPSTHPQIREVIGNFATIQLLGVESGGSDSFADRAKRLQAQFTKDLEHVHFSGHEVLRELNRLRRVGRHAVVPILFDSIVEFAHATYQSQGLEVAPSPAPLPPIASGMTQLEQTISLPQVLLLCVAQQAPDGSLRLITQAVEEVLEDGFVPALVNAYAAFLDRLAREDSAWVERSASAGQPTGRAAWPPVPAATAAQDRVLRDAASWTPIESEMAELWEAVLARRPETGSDDFYDLGGDSLRLARLLGRIRAHFQTTAPLPALLDVPTLEGMARAVQDAIASAGARSLWSPIASFLHRIKGRLRWRLQGSQT